MSAMCFLKFNFPSYFYIILHLKVELIMHKALRVLMEIWRDCSSDDCRIICMTVRGSWLTVTLWGVFTSLYWLIKGHGLLSHRRWLRIPHFMMIVACLNDFCSLILPVIQKDMHLNTTHSFPEFREEVPALSFELVVRSPGEWHMSVSLPLPRLFFLSLREILQQLFLVRI